MLTHIYCSLIIFGLGSYLEEMFQGGMVVYTPRILEAFTKYKSIFLSINFIVAIRVTIVWGTGTSFFGYSVAARFLSLPNNTETVEVWDLLLKIRCSNFFNAVYMTCNLLWLLVVQIQVYVVLCNL